MKISLHRTVPSAWRRWSLTLVCFSGIVFWTGLLENLANVNVLQQQQLLQVATLARRCNVLNATERTTIAQAVQRPYFVTIGMSQLIQRCFAPHKAWLDDGFYGYGQTVAVLDTAYWRDADEAAHVDGGEPTRLTVEHGGKSFTAAEATRMNEFDAQQYAACTSDYVHATHAERTSRPLVVAAYDAVGAAHALLRKELTYINRSACKHADDERHFAPLHRFEFGHGGPILRMYAMALPSVQLALVRVKGCCQATLNAATPVEVDDANVADRCAANRFALDYECIRRGLAWVTEHGRRLNVTDINLSVYSDAYGAMVPDDVPLSLQFDAELGSLARAGVVVHAPICNHYTMDALSWPAALHDIVGARSMREKVGSGAAWPRGGALRARHRAVPILWPSGCNAFSSECNLWLGTYSVVGRQYFANRYGARWPLVRAVDDAAREPHRAWLRWDRFYTTLLVESSPKHELEVDKTTLTVVCSDFFAALAAGNASLAFQCALLAASIRAPPSPPLVWPCRFWSHL